MNIKTTYDSSFYEKDFVQDTQQPLLDYSLVFCQNLEVVVFLNWYVTGFTDAEGCFSINTTTTATDKRSSIQSDTTS